MTLARGGPEQDRAEGAGRGGVVARNSLWNVVGSVLPLLAGLVAIPPVLNHLGKERFGILSLAWALLIYISIFDLGLNRAIVKFTAELLGRGKREEAPQVFWSALAVQAPLSIVGIIGFVLAVPLLTERVLSISPALRGETRQAFYVLAFFFPAMLLTLALRSLLQAVQRFDLINLVKVPATTGNFLIPLLGIALNLNLAGIFGLMLGFRVLVVGVYVLLVDRVLPEVKHNHGISRAMMGRLLTFGGWLTVSNMISPLVFYLESFFIGSLLSVGVLAYYSAPFEIVANFSIIPGAVAGALLPMISSLAENNREELERLFAGSVKYLFFLMAPLCLGSMALAGDILRIWLGPEFAARGGVVLVLLSVVFFINAFAYVPLTLLLALGRPDLKAKLDLFLLPLFAGLLWLVLPRAGVAGAAWAKMAVVLLDTVALFWFAFRVAGTGPGGLLSKGLVRGLFLGLGLAGLVLAVASVFEGFGPRLIGVGLSLLLFAILFVFVAMDREERETGLRTLGLGRRRR